MKNYHLTLEERIQIKLYIGEGYTRAEVGRKIGRHRSTIKRELDVWDIRDNLVEKIKDYDPHLAHWCKKENRGIVKRYEFKLNKFPKLLKKVIKKLKDHWSPEQISQWLKREFPDNKAMQVCHETIYQFIYNIAKGSLKEKLISYLRRKKRIRKSIKGSRKRKMKIKDRVSIHNRPKEVENRKKIGHWEGDLIIGKNKKTVIGTLVERTTRFTLIVKPKSRKSKDVVKAFAKALKSIPKQFKKSLTYDNGLEMANHKLFSKLTGMEVFFCDPYSSWQRGTNENTNGLIRGFWKKKTDFDLINNYQISKVQNLINNRPRKILNWSSPFIVFEAFCPS